MNDLTTSTPTAELAKRWFKDIYTISSDTEGVNRPAFSAKETTVLTYLLHEAEAHGLCADFDKGQNLVISLPEHKNSQKFALVGSHIDSVPMGGNYDGLAGVLAGLLVLVRARMSGTKIPRPVKVIAIRGEESAWFGPCYIGSKALTGTLSRKELNSSHRDDGRALIDHMADIGVDVSAVKKGNAFIPTEDILEFIELHIEQGPLLIEKNNPAALVSGIRGNFRYRHIRCIGESGHSGAVPLAYRKDPVLAMADLLSRLDGKWRAIVQKGGDLVVTSGMVGTDPEKHAMSRIPDEVSFSLDIRSQSIDVLEEMAVTLGSEIRQIEIERGVGFDLGTVNKTPPALMDADLVSALKGAAKRLGMEPTVMASGGGHDAAVFANAGVPTAMVFIRNENGSHNPDEAMDIDDFLVGADIIYEHLTGIPS